jgi:ubiquitin-protein ligase
MDSLKNRITKEFEELNKNKNENAVEVWLIDNNIRHWKGKIKGPVIKIIIIYIEFIK